MRDERAAARFREAVDHAWQRIAADPTALAVWKGTFRYIRVKRFPYVMYFREVAKNQVIVLAVAHTSRRPGYWRSRTASP